MKTKTAMWDEKTDAGRGSLPGRGNVTGIVCAAGIVALLAARASDTTCPTTAHTAYQEREILSLIHWGPNTYTDQEWGYGNVPASRVNPDALDPEQWVVALKAAEIKSALLVAKHHDGFCLWPSKLCTDGYSTASASGTAKGRDIVGELAAACRKHGLKFGVYISPWDRHRADYGKPSYVDYFLAQWREVLSNYGEICEVWLDGANGGTGWYGGARGGKGERRSISEGYYRLPELVRMMHGLQPMALARSYGDAYEWASLWHGGSEAGQAPETWKYVRLGKDGARHWMPPECGTPFRRGWFWHAREKPKSLEQLVKTYYTTVGRSTVLNLGVAPDRHGRVCDADVKRLKEFGDWVRAFNATDVAAGAVRSETAAGNVLTVTLRMPKPVLFNTFDLKEDLRNGQRVETFAFEAKEGGVWKRKFSGTTVGYRRFVNVGETVAGEVRVILTGSETPALAAFALRHGVVARSAATVAAAGARSRAKWRPIWAGDGQPDAVKKALDGNVRTLWRTREGSPQGFAIDCGAEVAIDGFVYVPRQDGRSDGTIDAYEFHTSDDGRNWTLRVCGEFGNIAANPVKQCIALPVPVKARYVKFVATHVLGNGGATVAEFGLLKERLATGR